jgi:hypothetical protein
MPNKSNKKQKTKDTRERTHNSVTESQNDGVTSTEISIAQGEGRPAGSGTDVEDGAESPLSSLSPFSSPLTTPGSTPANTSRSGTPHIQSTGTGAADKPIEQEVTRLSERDEARQSGRQREGQKRRRSESSELSTDSPERCMDGNTECQGERDRHRHNRDEDSDEERTNINRDDEAQEMDGMVVDEGIRGQDQLKSTDPNARTSDDDDETESDEASDDVVQSGENGKGTKTSIAKGAVGERESDTEQGTMKLVSRIEKGSLISLDDVYEMAQFGDDSKALFLLSPVAQSMRYHMSPVQLADILRAARTDPAGALPELPTMHNCICDLYNLNYHFACLVDRSARCTDYDRRWLVRATFKPYVLSSSGIKTAFVLHGHLQRQVLDRIAFAIAETEVTMDMTQYVCVEPRILHNKTVDNVSEIARWEEIVTTYCRTFMSKSNEKVVEKESLPEAEGSELGAATNDHSSNAVVQSLLRRATFVEGKAKTMYVEELFCLAALGLRALMLVSLLQQFFFCPLDSIPVSMFTFQRVLQYKSC